MVAGLGRLPDQHGFSHLCGRHVRGCHRPQPQRGIPASISSVSPQWHRRCDAITCFSAPWRDDPAELWRLTNLMGGMLVILGLPGGLHGSGGLLGLPLCWARAMTCHQAVMCAGLCGRPGATPSSGYREHATMSPLSLRHVQPGLHGGPHRGRLLPGGRDLSAPDHRLHQGLRPRRLPAGRLIRGAGYLKDLPGPSPSRDGLRLNGNDRYIHYLFLGGKQKWQRIGRVHPRLCISSKGKRTKHPIEVTPPTACLWPRRPDRRQPPNCWQFTLIGELSAIRRGGLPPTKVATGSHRHEQAIKGEHKRMGATDVIPFVPQSKDVTVECMELSSVAQRIWDELRALLPCMRTPTCPQPEPGHRIRKGGIRGHARKVFPARLGSLITASGRSTPPPASPPSAPVRPFFFSGRLQHPTWPLPGTWRLPRRSRGHPRFSGGFRSCKGHGLHAGGPGHRSESP